MRWNRPVVLALPWACAAFLTVIAPPASAVTHVEAPAAQTARHAADGDGDGHDMDMTDAEMAQMGQAGDGATAPSTEATHGGMDMTDDEMAHMGDGGGASTPPPADTTHDGMNMTDDEMATMGHDGGATHGDGGGTTSRPRAGVVGGFVLVNGAVLGAAAVVRRRTRSRSAHRPPSGPATPTQTTTA